MKIELKLQWILEGEPLPETLIQLLDGVARGGSLLFAAREIPVSYRHAWGLLRQWEAKLGKPLVNLEQGRGAKLTAAGDSMRQRWYQVGERTVVSLREASQEAAKALDLVFETSTLPSVVAVCASHGFGIKVAIDRWRERGHALGVEYIGSESSLRRYAAGECQVAGFHLPLGRLGRQLWPRYQPFLDPRRDVFFVVEAREVGFMARAGWPIVTIESLIAGGWRFINRQSGSGSRLVFDLLLAEAGEASNTIKGYGNEEYTHLAVAAVIAAQGADAGFGARAAAERFNLQFWPALTEKYLVVVPRKLKGSAAFAALTKILRSKAYRQTLAAIPGCNPHQAGQMMTVNQLATSLKAPRD